MTSRAAETAENQSDDMQWNWTVIEPCDMEWSQLLVFTAMQSSHEFVIWQLDGRANG